MWDRDERKRHDLIGCRVRFAKSSGAVKEIPDGTLSRSRTKQRLPECLEDWICEDNAVRAIDVFVDELALAELGLGGVVTQLTLSTLR